MFSILKRFGCIALVVYFILGFPRNLYAQLKPESGVLEMHFKNPPQDTRPIVWWRWYGRQISKDGITRDLEAMKKAGIGGFYHFQLRPNVPDILNDSNSVLPNVPILSNEWWDLIQFSIKEADRLGLEATFHNSLGWSSSGGPWVTPEKSMQKLVWTELIVIGGNKVSIKLEQPTVDPKWNFYKDVAVLAYPVNDTGVIALKSIRDISSFLSSDGTIQWEAPAGRWKIIRYGHTTTGKFPVQGPMEVAGLECDKMDRNALKFFFDQYPGRILKEAGYLAGKSLKYIAIDSYEAGLQNWNHQFRSQFIKRRGYDPVIWLPVITGKQPENYDTRNKPSVVSNIIESKHISERFLYDFERTISELFMEEYYASMTDLVRVYKGVQLEVQSYNAPFNLVENAVHNEMPAGEFWHNNKGYGWWTLNLAASAAHIKGSKIVSAESFTSEPQHGNWSVSPEDLKAEADLAFSKGINRMELHIQPHQPWGDRVIPGMIGGSYGLQLNPSSTFWMQSLSWNTYLSRCQYLLRQGQFVGDICYLYPKGQRGFSLPDGFNGDAIDEQSLIRLMYVKDGKLCLPGGMQYQLLVLNKSSVMSLALAKKIRQLVYDGGVVVGEKPTSTPSLENFPEQDINVRIIGEEMWDKKDEFLNDVIHFGKGKIFSNMKVEDALKKIGNTEDLIIENLDTARSIVWTHRKTENRDIYFISNQVRKSSTLNISFRVLGKIPELWNAETGEIIKNIEWKPVGRRIQVTIPFESLQSWFVVFKQGHVSKNGTSNIYGKAKPKMKIDLSENWMLDFNNVQGTPPAFALKRLASWTENENLHVKYFSGSAQYTKLFNVPGGALNQAEKIILDLGVVRNFADVYINGNCVANLWKYPYTINIKPFIQSGRNSLKISVTNLWANRMIGDEQEPLDMEWTNESFSSGGLYKGKELVKYPEWFVHGKQRPSIGRYTFSTWNYYRKTDSLLTSGLLGPVKLYVY